MESQALRHVLHVMGMVHPNQPDSLQGLQRALPLKASHYRFQLRHVLHIIGMIHPNQADSLQGLQDGNFEALAANDLGIGAGWQQNKRNWALSAVVGRWNRVIYSDIRLRTTGVTPPVFYFHLKGWRALPLKAPHYRFHRWSAPSGSIMMRVRHVSGWTCL